ncbi:MAG TPA: sensor histidine kinase [Chloroflexia bacterium]|nr:sensor histidine kinase [Chloroflexia bacterium]
MQSARTGYKIELATAQVNLSLLLENFLAGIKGAIMAELGRLLARLSKNKILSVISIAVLSTVIAYLVSLSRPELLLDVFYGIPVVLGLLSFGRWGGLAVATTSIIFFYFSNYYFKGVSFAEAWLSTLLTYVLFLLFSYGAYKFLLNQRKLSEAQAQLQTRLEVQDQLHRQSQILHQQNLKMAVVDERNRIAREIHDVLAQGLTAIILKVEIAYLNENIPPAVKQRLDEIYELARYHLHEARRSVADLRPLPLDGKSLQEALQARIKAFQAQYQIETRFESSGEIKPLPSEVETALYRIAQEALNNAGQHSNAEQVSVNLDYDEDEVCLTVQDDGRGFELKPGADTGNSQPKNPKSYGLSTMQERADMIGGWISIQSSPRGGCRVRVSVPYSSTIALKSEVEISRPGNSTEKAGTYK